MPSGAGWALSSTRSNVLPPTRGIPFTSFSNKSIILRVCFCLFDQPLVPLNLVVRGKTPCKQIRLGFTLFLRVSWDDAAGIQALGPKRGLEEACSFMSSISSRAKLSPSNLLFRLFTAGSRNLMLYLSWDPFSGGQFCLVRVGHRTVRLQIDNSNRSQ